jgi:serine palmitoyltransferase
VCYYLPRPVPPPLRSHAPLLLLLSPPPPFRVERDAETGAPDVQQCVNLGSYNYLGFADDWAHTCRDEVLGALDRHPVSLCTSFAEGGYAAIHAEVEHSIATFLHKEDAIIFNMGWATNGLGIPSILGKGSLIISDSLNHNSIVAGARGSGAEVRVFRHNDIAGLDALLRRSIVEGQPRTHRPWKKILVCVEGIYSMEGEYVDLPGVVATAKKYKAFVYLDEAHSIGAMGPTGRGIVEHWMSKGAKVSFADIDVMMGTFTKSFGAMGGYLAGSKAFISHVRRCTAGFVVDNAMSPVVAQQILTSLAVIKSEGPTHGAKIVPNTSGEGDALLTVGQAKLRQLRDNSRYLRGRLRAMDLEVFGDEDSPVIPVMIYNPTKLSAFSRECLKRNVSPPLVTRPLPPRPYTPV